MRGDDVAVGPFGGSPIEPGPPAPAGNGSERRSSWRSWPGTASPTVWFAFGFVALLIVGAALADWIPGLANPGIQSGKFHASPTLDMNGLFGMDPIGRSIFARCIYGARVSLTIAVFATLIGMLIGVSLGMLAGYYRGFTERVVDTYANALASLPPLLVLLALVAAVGASLGTMTVALGILGSGMYARVTKGAVISHAGREYILAARALGASDVRIMVQELLPNLVPAFTSIVPPAMAGLIIVEGSLSFLGYGIPPPAPSWGGMIASTSDVMNQFPYLLLGPMLAIVLTVYSLNTIGDYMSARINVREGQL